MKRIMGLDFGAKTVGVAVSDPLGITAQGVEVIVREREDKLRRTLARLEELIAQYQVERIVVGCPRHMNGDFGERAEKSRAFAERLSERTGLPTELWDERLTTVAAERVLMESGVRREHRKEYVDKIAAVFTIRISIDTWIPCNFVLEKSGLEKLWMRGLF